VILAGYIGSWLMAGASWRWVRVGHHQEPGASRRVLPVPDDEQRRERLGPAIQVIANFVAKGVLDARDVIFFTTLIGLFLLGTACVLELKKS
jgi:hypothetical protein